MSSVAITGMGIISAIGNNQQEVMKSLLEGKTGIRYTRFLSTKHSQYPVGEVKLSNTQLATQLNLSGIFSRATLLGLVAAREAIGQAGLNASDLLKSAFISGTCVGGMDITEQHFQAFENTSDFDFLLRQHPCGEHARFIAEQLGIGALCTTLSTACSSALNAIGIGINLIRSQRAEVVIVGSSESLTNYHFNGFRTLHILDEQQCRPFDDTRTGINLGEGAAYLVLESEQSYLRRNAKPIAYISGFGNACDAFHQTASSDNGEGAFRAMEKALTDARLKPEQISYLNAHGTGTPNNDLSESKAILRVFGDNYPPTSSTKGFTGHTTAASGAIESVICLLAMQHGFIPTNLNFSTCMSDGGIIPFAGSCLTNSTNLQHIMCNAFGFGGNDSSVIFSKEPENHHSNQQGKHLYIKCCTQISAQQPLSEDWFDNPIQSDSDTLATIDPNFGDYISAGQSRRLGPLLKRALCTALYCMRETGVAHPDAIIAGTGLGCIANTENFLRQIIDNGEEMLTPTQFMQSTHNTISSLLAIQTATHSYNATYSQLDTSFESCIIDVYNQLISSDKDIHNILIGAYDELTPTVSDLMKRAGLTSKLSETAMSMLLTTDKTSCEITDYVHPTSDTQTIHHLKDIIKNDDYLLLGINGSPEYDLQYSKIIRLYGDMPMLHYKHLFGENLSSSGMGLYVAAQCIMHERIPECLLYKNASTAQLQGIVFINYSYDKRLSIVRLQNSL